VVVNALGIAQHGIAIIHQQGAAIIINSLNLLRGCRIRKHSHDVLQGLLRLKDKPQSAGRGGRTADDQRVLLPVF